MLLLAMLITINLIPLFGQTGDTLTCYTNTELKRIATRIIYANECDTLLNIAYTSITIQDSIIHNQIKIISAKDTTIQLLNANYDNCAQINKLKDTQLLNKDKELHKVQTTFRLTTIGLIGLIILILL